MRQIALNMMSGICDFIASIFYPRCKGLIGVNVMVSVFFTQRILGFNRMVPWPVHHTSKIIYRNNISLGVRSFPGWSPGCYIQARNGIRIGNNLRMGPGVGLISSNHQMNDYDGWTSDPPIVIGDNVWLGMGVIVLPGVIIGDNVMVAAGAVVNSDVPSNSIYGGIPAKKIGDKDQYNGRAYH